MAMSTLNAHFGDLLKATDVAAIATGVGMEALVEQFTFADEYDQYEDRIILKKGLDNKSWWYLGGLINAVITEAKDLLTVSMKGFDKTVAPYVTALQDMFSLSYSVYLFLGTLEPDQKDANT
jgi:hypothetical protein